MRRGADLRRTIGDTAPRRTSGGSEKDPKETTPRLRNLNIPLHPARSTPPLVPAKSLRHCIRRDAANRRVEVRRRASEASLSWKMPLERRNAVQRSSAAGLIIRRASMTESSPNAVIESRQHRYDGSFAASRGVSRPPFSVGQDRPLPPLPSPLRFTARKSVPPVVPQAAAHPDAKAARHVRFLSEDGEVGKYDVSVWVRSCRFSPVGQLSATQAETKRCSSHRRISIKSSPETLRVGSHTLARNHVSAPTESRDYCSFSNRSPSQSHTH